MILIADGGTTKCDWIGCDASGAGIKFTTTTKGLNPAYFSIQDLEQILSGSEELRNIVSEVEEVYFFGSGCGEGIYEKKLDTVISSFFRDAGRIRVSGDIHGAVYACTDTKGVVGILGTGSNICFFNGITIEFEVPSLGYTIMDQGSGNALGRKLLQDYFFKRMPDDLRKEFEDAYDLDVDYVKTKLYDSPGPSSYMATFAIFLFERLDNIYMKKLLLSTLEEFFDTSVSVYRKRLSTVPLHFVGSIAHYSKEYLKQICDQRSIQLGNVIKNPILKLSGRLDLLRNLP